MKTEYLLQREVDNVLSALTPENALVMRVVLHTGLRVSDVLQLKTADLKPHFWVTESKTQKKRQVGLPQPLLSDLEKAAGPVYVFPSRLHQLRHRTRQTVWKDVKRAAAAFRIPQNVGTHSGRKVFAVDLLQKYGDIDRVRRALNHSDYATTMIYAMADKQLESNNKRRRAAAGRRKV